jgi:hypothetical protein
MVGNDSHQMGSAGMVGKDVRQGWLAWMVGRKWSVGMVRRIFKNTVQYTSLYSNTYTVYIHNNKKIDIYTVECQVLYPTTALIELNLKYFVLQKSGRNRNINLLQFKGHMNSYQARLFS